MIKGVNKNIVVVKDKKSKIFEEAIFILKPDVYQKKPSKFEISKEIQRILSQNSF